MPPDTDLKTPSPSSPKRLQFLISSKPISCRRLKEPMSTFLRDLLFGQGPATIGEKSYEPKPSTITFFSKALVRGVTKKSFHESSPLLQYVLKEHIKGLKLQPSLNMTNYCSCEGEGTITGGEYDAINAAHVVGISAERAHLLPQGTEKA